MHRAAAPLLFGPLLTLGCGSAGAPVQYRFAGMREPAAALACAKAGLEREGFVETEPASEAQTAVMLRRPVPTSYGPGEWWRVEISVATDDDGRTVVASLAGASRQAAGPYAGPPSELQHVVGTLASRCTY